MRIFLFSFLTLFATSTVATTIATNVTTVEAAKEEKSPTSLYNRGNATYADSNWTEAIASYERAVATNISNPALWYNLGNSYFRTRQLGAAILSYERAIRLSGADEDIRQNLAFAQSFTVDTSEENAEGKALGLLRSLLRQLNFNMVVGVASAAFFVTCVLLGTIVLAPYRRTRSWIAMASLAVLTAVSCASLAGLNELVSDDGSAGVIIVPKVDVRFAPAPEAEIGYLFHEGTIVYQDRKKDGWIRVRLGDGRGGWVPENTVEVIAP